MRYHIFDKYIFNDNPVNDEFNVWLDYRDYNGQANPDTDVLVKELIDSDKFLKLVLKYHNPNKNRLFHIFYNDEKDYIITDCVINYKLDTKGKLELAKQATKFYTTIFNQGDTVVVNLLTPNGHLSPVIPTSIENQAICEMLYNDKELEMGVSYIFDYKQLDFCLNEYTRYIKEGENSWPHNANVIIVNDLNEGNTLYKALSIGGNKLYGYVIGANIDVVLNSRSYLTNNDISCYLLEK